LYAPVTVTAIELRQGVAAVRNFDLPAPHLDHAPRALEQALTFGDQVTDGAGLVLNNTGQLPLDFAIAEPPSATWLAASPLAGSVPVSAAQNVTITWGGDTLRVDQPGVYTTALHLNTTDPEAQDVSLPVTLTVQPASTQGLLTGVVSTTGSCDVNRAPLAGAQLYFTGFDGFTRSTTADRDGAYRYWLDQTHSPYTVTATALDHAPWEQATAAVVSISGGLTSTQSFTLRLQQPCLSWSPAAVMAELEAGQSISRQVTITNSGALPLNVMLYEAGAEPPGGGPDAGGCTWRRSPYRWIDATDGTPLNLADDGEANIVLPFDFPFYDGASNRFRIGNNGAVLFDAEVGEVPAFNQALHDAPDRFIAPYWDDLDSLTGPGNVYWKTIGTVPDRSVVIAWYNRPHFGATSGAITFELVLHENGNIAYQYHDTSFNNPALNDGASATIGLRGVGLTQLLQISYQAPVVSAGQAFCFARPGNPPCDATDDAWWSFTPDSIGGLIGTPPHSTTITIALTAASSLGGVYSGTLRLVSNDPFQMDANIPVALKVLVRHAYVPVVRK